jgi:ABC-type uncharacterized transport system permease subunit
MSTDAFPARLAQRRSDLLASATPLLVSVGVAAASLLASLAIVALTGHSIGASASAFLEGAFGSRDQVAATVSVMIPLVLVGLAWILASSARQINLGLEGQILAGGICTTLAGVELEGLPQALHVPAAVAAGAVGGALWAGLPALMYVRRDVSVLLSSFLLNFVALLLVSWLIRGPMQNPAGIVRLESAPVALSAQWPRLGTTTLAWDVLYIPIAVVVLMFVQRWTTVGFRLRLVSANEEAARHAGIPTRRLGALALIVSGAIAGVAGSALILDSFGGTMTDGFSSGYGFIGIAVALLARNSPAGCIVAALLFAALQQGGGLLETRVGVSAAVVDVTQGLVIVLVAGSAWLLLRLGLRRRPLAPLPERSDGAV